MWSEQIVFLYRYSILMFVLKLQKLAYIYFDLVGLNEYIIINHPLTTLTCDMVGSGTLCKLSSKFLIGLV